MSKSSTNQNSNVIAAEATVTNILVIHGYNEIPSWLTADELAEYIHETIKPYEDTLKDTRRAVDDALNSDSPKGGFILLAESNQKPKGALIMLRTGMKGYVPENILLMVCVDPASRGRGLGGRLIRKGIELADGDVKLHVEYDNPAKQVYEKIGFTTKYAEMRYNK
jgi:ribosomal-protein-alanine N-acetyltransferase